MPFILQGLWHFGPLINAVLGRLLMRYQNRDIVQKELEFSTGEGNKIRPHCLFYRQHPGEKSVRWLCKALKSQTLYHESALI